MAVSRFSRPTREAFVPLPYDKMQGLLMQGEQDIRMREHEMSELQAMLRNMNIVEGDRAYLEGRVGEFEQLVDKYDKKYNSYLDPNARREWNQMSHGITNDKYLNALSEQYKRKLKEDELIQAITVEGGTTLFSTDWSKVSTVDNEGRINLTNTELQKKLDWDKRMTEIANFSLQEEETSWKGTIPDAKSMQVANRVLLEIPKGSWKGINEKQVLNKLGSMFEQYKDTNEYTQQKKVLTKQGLSNDDADLLIMSELEKVGRGKIHGSTKDDSQIISNPLYKGGENGGSILDIKGDIGINTSTMSTSDINVSGFGETIKVSESAAKSAENTIRALVGKVSSNTPFYLLGRGTNDNPTYTTVQDITSLTSIKNYKPKTKPIDISTISSQQFNRLNQEDQISFMNALDTYNTEMVNIENAKNKAEAIADATGFDAYKEVSNALNFGRFHPNVQQVIADGIINGLKFDDLKTQLEVLGLEEDRNKLNFGKLTGSAIVSPAIVSNPYTAALALIVGMQTGSSSPKTVQFENEYLNLSKKYNNQLKEKGNIEYPNNIIDITGTNSEEQLKFISNGVVDRNITIKIDGKLSTDKHTDTYKWLEDNQKKGNSLIVRPTMSPTGKFDEFAFTFYDNNGKLVGTKFGTLEGNYQQTGQFQQMLFNDMVNIGQKYYQQGNTIKGKNLFDAGSYGLALMTPTPQGTIGEQLEKLNISRAKKGDEFSFILPSDKKINIKSYGNYWDGDIYVGGKYGKLSELFNVNGFSSVNSILTVLQQQGLLND